MNFTPLNDLVYIKVDALEGEVKSSSGIIMAMHKDVVMDRPTEGIVEGVGSKVKHVKPGMKVFFENIRGQDIDNEHIVVAEEYIVGYMNEK